MLHAWFLKTVGNKLPGKDYAAERIIMQKKRLKFKKWSLYDYSNSLLFVCLAQMFYLAKILNYKLSTNEGLINILQYAFKSKIF